MKNKNASILNASNPNAVRSATLTGFTTVPIMNIRRRNGGMEELRFMHGLHIRRRFKDLSACAAPDIVWVREEVHFQKKTHSEMWFTQDTPQVTMQVTPQDTELVTRQVPQDTAHDTAHDTAQVKELIINIKEEMTRVEMQLIRIGRFKVKEKMHENS